MIDRIFAALPSATVAVVGDFFVDRYLRVDPALQETSLETGLPAHQVVAVTTSAGGAGNVAANLCALGVGQVHCVGVVGDDGDGFTLHRDLVAAGADFAGMVKTRRLTSCYVKPMHDGAEGSRYDVRSRAPLEEDTERALLEVLAAVRADAIVVVDQLDTGGVCTPAVIAGLRARGGRIVVDSRWRLGAFDFAHRKPNQAEATRLLGPGRPEAHAALLAASSGRASFVTCGVQGLVTCEFGDEPARVAAPRIAGPVDPVGAGDAVAAALACALLAGCGALDAARFAARCAAVTVAKTGTTGTASRAEVRRVKDEPGLPENE